MDLTTKGSGRKRGKPGAKEEGDEKNY